MEFSWADFIRKESASTLSYQDAAQAYAAIDAALARSLNAVTAYKATIPSLTAVKSCKATIPILAAVKSCKATIPILAAVKSCKATIPQEQEIPPLRMEQATLMPRCTSYGTWVPGIEASLPNGDK